jgi:hypothetical protein
LAATNACIWTVNRCRHDAATDHCQLLPVTLANSAHGLQATQWSFEMQYNNQSIASSCRLAKDMPILTTYFHLAYTTNTAMVEAEINLIKH